MKMRGGQCSAEPLIAYDIMKLSKIPAQIE